MASFIWITRFTEIRHEIKHGFSHAHILAAVILAEIRHAHHKRKSEDVWQILTTDAAQALFQSK